VRLRGWPELLLWGWARLRSRPLHRLWMGLRSGLWCRAVLGLRCRLRLRLRCWTELGLRRSVLRLFGVGLRPWLRLRLDGTRLRLLLRWSGPVVGVNRPLLRLAAGTVVRLDGADLGFGPSHLVLTRAHLRLSWPYFRLSRSYFGLIGVSRLCLRPVFRADGASDCFAGTHCRLTSRLHS
jgi:hypothetical protein